LNVQRYGATADERTQFSERQDERTDEFRLGEATFHSTVNTHPLNTFKAVDNSKINGP